MNHASYLSSLKSDVSCREHRYATVCGTVRFYLMRFNCVFCISTQVNARYAANRICRNIYNNLLRDSIFCSGLRTLWRALLKNDDRQLSSSHLYFSICMENYISPQYFAMLQYLLTNFFQDIKVIEA